MTRFTGEAGAALAFAILYFCMAIWMYTGYATGRYKLKSKWTLLTFHTTIRVASQACGVAFGILAFSNTSVFIAYLVLGAEGYFSLTLASYLFLKSWQRKNLGFSFLGPHHMSKQEERTYTIELLTLQPLLMPWRFHAHHFLAIVHAVLIPANALIITGGSYLAGTTEQDALDDPTALAHQQAISKALRTTGAALFYAMTVAFCGCLYKAFRDQAKYRRQGRIERSSCHPTLVLLAGAAFWLNIRGIFGVLQSCIGILSYTSTTNYTAEGFTARFTAIEVCLTVLPEFAAAFLLNLTYFTAKQDELHPEPEDLDDFAQLKNMSSSKA